MLSLLCVVLTTTTLAVRSRVVALLLSWLQMQDDNASESKGLFTADDLYRSEVTWTSRLSYRTPSWSRASAPRSWLAAVYDRAVLTNGHTGHVPRAPGFFFFVRGPQLAVAKIFFKTNHLIIFAKINCKGNPVNTFYRGAPFGWGCPGP